MTIHSEALDDEKLRIIRLQAQLVSEGQFFLAGGTALGIRFGHRISKDLDWFSPNNFDAKALRASLEKLSEKPTAFQQNSAHTLRAYYGQLETSFIAYRQMPPQVEHLPLAGQQIPVASIQMLAVMKAAALHDRGTKRDFIDVREICRQPGWSVAKFIMTATNNLPLQPKQMELALSYFKDAERDPMPAGYKHTWETVKADLSKGLESWRRDRDLSR